MFCFLVAALCISSTAAFTPAPMTSRVSMSRVATSSTPLVTAPVRAEVSMSAVTERDADGNPVTHYEMCAEAPNPVPCTCCCVSAHTQEVVAMHARNPAASMADHAHDSCVPWSAMSCSQRTRTVYCAHPHKKWLPCMPTIGRRARLIMHDSCAQV